MSGQESSEKSIYEISESELQTLREKAIEAKSRAYCPYSHFRVGACLLLAESPAQQSSSSPNLYVTGSNVEIASTPVGICAERCALAPCVASFTRPAMPVVRAVAVSTDISPPSSPCGMCRQFLREFCASDVKVYMYGVDNGKVVGPQIMTMGELLPMSFGPNDLEKRAAT